MNNSERAKACAEEIELGIMTRGYIDHHEIPAIITKHFPPEGVNENLIKTLKDYLRRCRECGGTGVGRDGQGEPYQCQWCDAGLSAIAAAQSQPKVDGELVEAFRNLEIEVDTALSKEDLGADGPGSSTLDDYRTKAHRDARAALARYEKGKE